MNLWTWADSHFLLSDSQNHLYSGFHLHGGGQSTMQPQDNRKKIQDEDVLIMKIVKEFLKHQF